MYSSYDFLPTAVCLTLITLPRSHPLLRQGQRLFGFRVVAKILNDGNRSAILSFRTLPIVFSWAHIKLVLCRLFQIPQQLTFPYR
jgi:hypothetical protein